MSGIQQTPSDVIRLTENDIVPNVVMIVDPRNYSISEWNCRTEDITSNIKQLEDSILEMGFRTPILADEHLKIIDGHRRWSIALKHMLMIPVIHRVYGDTIDGNIQRALDSISANLGHPNTTTEIGEMISKLLKLGIPTTHIARKLGWSPRQLADYTTILSLPKEVPPEDIEKIKSKLRTMSSREIKTFDRVVTRKDLKPEQIAEELEKFTQLPNSSQDAYAKDILDGPVDLDSRLKLINNAITIQWEERVNYEHHKKWAAFRSARNWDRVHLLHSLHNALVTRAQLRFSEFDQKAYTDFGPDFVYDR